MTGKTEPLSRYRGALRAFITEKSVEAANELWAMRNDVPPKEGVAIRKLFIDKVLPNAERVDVHQVDDRGLPRAVSVEELRLLNQTRRLLMGEVDGADDSGNH
jgi:hypothetical protein